MNVLVAEYILALHIFLVDGRTRRSAHRQTADGIAMAELWRLS